MSESSNNVNNQDKGLLQDFLGEVLNLDHGLPGTLKMMVTDPKQVIDGYFTDKPDYVNPFRYTIFLLAITTLISSLIMDYDVIMERSARLGTQASPEELEANFEKLKQETGFDMAAFMDAMKDVSVAISTKFSQLLYILVLAPLMAFSSRLFFKKLQPNFKHHYVIMLYTLATFSVLSTFISPLMMTDINLGLIIFLTAVSQLIVIVYVQVRYFRINTVGGYIKSSLSFVIGYTLYMIATIFIQVGGALLMIML